MFKKGFIWFTIAGFLMSFALLGCTKTDLEYAVPSTDMYQTTAYQLSPEEVEKATGSGFFSYVEKFIKIEKRTNPIAIDGKEMEKVPSTNPNIQPLKDVVLFRSCFYNSGTSGHTPESKVGLFVSQAALFRTKEAADSFEKDLLKGFGNHYTLVIRKENVVGAINMYPGNIGPTKEFRELAKFVTQHGFKVVAIY